VYWSFGPWRLNAITAGKFPVIAPSVEAAQAIPILGDAFVA
jgi:hypothetical protein